MSGLFPYSALFNNLLAPPGTRMPFNQATAPVGWTTDGSASFTDCAIRVNQSTAGSTGGSATWSSWYQGGTNNAQGFTLTTANLPAHSHTVVDNGHVMTASGAILEADGGPSINYGSNCAAITGFTSSGLTTTSTNAANVSVGNAGSGSTITPSFTSPNVKFSDHIIGVKT